MSYTIYTILDGEDAILSIANDKQEVSKIISRHRELYKNIDGVLHFEVNGVRYEPSQEQPVDVKRIAKNAKTRWIEDRIMGDLYQL